MAKNFVIFLKISIFAYVFNAVNCGQNLLILDLSPGFPENSQFWSYHIAVNCHNERATVAKALEYNITKESKDVLWTSFSEGGKAFERVLFDFNEAKCANYSIFIKIKKLKIENKKLVENEHYPLLGILAKDYVHVNKKAASNGRTEFNITCKYFFVNLTPVLTQKEEFYEIKVYCNDKEQQNLVYHSDIQCVNGGECQRMILADEQKCQTNVYDVQVWRWSSMNEREMYLTEPRSTYFSDIHINDGEILEIQENSDGFQTLVKKN